MLEVQSLDSITCACFSSDISLNSSDSVYACLSVWTTLSLKSPPRSWFRPLLSISSAVVSLAYLYQDFSSWVLWPSLITRGYRRLLQGSLGYGIAHATRNKAITTTTEFFGKVNEQNNLGKSPDEIKETATKFVDENLDKGMQATTAELIDRSGLNQDRGDLRDKVVQTQFERYRIRS